MYQLMPRHVTSRHVTNGWTEYPTISEMLPDKWRSFGLATTEVLIFVIGTFGALNGRRRTAEATWR